MDNLINEIKNTAKARNIPIIEDAPCEVLCNAVRERQPQRILEIGTAIGYSGILMLLSSPNATLTTIENDIDRMNEARQNFTRAKLNSRVRFIEDDANFVVSVMEGQFDFILLDGPKGHYHTMLPYLLRLLTQNGMIFVDDILYHGYIEGEDYPMHKHRTIITSLRKLIKDAQSDKRLKCEIIKVGDGVMLIEKV